MALKQARGKPIGRTDVGGLRRQLQSELEQLSRRHGLGRVFADFVELACLSFSNAVDRASYDVREARYHEIRRGYDAKAFERFPAMLAQLTRILELAGFDDALGTLYMALGLGNNRSGQVFTPYHIARFLGSMTVEGGAMTSEQDFLDLAEPACGAGGIVIGVADALASAGVNYQRRLHATCTDIDLRCVHMSYLQLSLLHVPAIVVHGNALSGQVWSRWYTPAHVLGRWSQRLAARRHEAPNAEGEFVSSRDDDVKAAPVSSGATLREQMQLF